MATDVIPKLSLEDARAMAESLMLGGTYEGLNVRWSPANIAWLICWHDTVLRIINRHDRPEAIDYLTSILRGD